MFISSKTFLKTLFCSCCCSSGKILAFAGRATKMLTVTSYSPCVKTIKKSHLRVLTYKLYCSFNTSNKITHITAAVTKNIKSWDCNHRLWCCDLLFVDPRNNHVAVQVEAKPGTWKVVDTLKTTGLKCLPWYLHRNTGGKRNPDIFWKTK